MFVDGKADTTDTYEVFYQIVNETDRLDDFYVLNFLNPYQSNTFNPLIMGDDDFCVEICAGFLGKAGDQGQYWQERGLVLMRSVMSVLVWLRDNKGEYFTFWDIKKRLAMDELLELAKRIENPKNEDERIPLRDENGKLIGERLISYLNSLGPWRKLLANDPNAVMVTEQVVKQHGFAVQQWDSALDLLGGTYAPIFNARYPDINMQDIITNSRILYVLLPSLGKSETTLQQMGKLILSTVKVALNNMLGKDVMGEREEIFRRVKRSRPEIPFFIILDEYGSYSVPGFSTVLAQARSLNCAVCISAQELGRLMKDKEEGEALLANTNIKIFMKIEDPNTGKIAIERADEAWEIVPSNLRKHYGLIKEGEYADSWSVQERKRLKILDLVKMEPGDAWLIYNDQLIKFKFPYLKGKPVKKLGILKPKLINPALQQTDTKIETKKSYDIREKADKMMAAILLEGNCYIPLTVDLIAHLIEKMGIYGTRYLFEMTNKNDPGHLYNTTKFIKFYESCKKTGETMYEKHFANLTRPTRTAQTITEKIKQLLT